MSSVSIRLGQMRVSGFDVVRSGIRWLCSDGHVCRPGEIIAFCNIGFRRSSGSVGTAIPFADEARDLQVAFAAPLAGTLRRAPGLNRGGFQAFQFSDAWAADERIGSLETETRDTSAPEVLEPQLLMMAGRRMTGLAEGRSGLLTGWFDRSRASKVDGAGSIGTLLNLGACEMLAVRGEKLAYLEMLEAVEGPAQFVSVSDNQLIHNARILAEQSRRSSAECQLIAEDLARTFGSGNVTPDAADWMFAGAMLGALQSSPAYEKYVVLTRDGFRHAGPPDAIILSLASEGTTLLKHRRLGYTLDIHGFRLDDAGIAFRGWLRENFEPIGRSVDDIRNDYCALTDLLRTNHPGTEILVSNLVSTSGGEEIQNYAWFEEPLGRTLKSVHSKDMNLMLYDLARERNIAIIDSDGIAAELGSSICIRDGVHPNGIMQAEMRSEILHILRARRVPGFGPAR